MGKSALIHTSSERFFSIPCHLLIPSPRENLFECFLEYANVVINQCFSLCWAIITQNADEAKVSRNANQYI